MLSSQLQGLTPKPWMIHATAAALLLGVSFGVNAAYFAPTHLDIEQRIDRMLQLESLMANKERIASEHQRLSHRLADLEKSVAVVRKRMPRRSPSQEFIERISQLASFHGCRIEMCTASAPQSLPTHSQVEVTCRLKGDYAGVCRLLTGVDQLSQISRISSLELETADDSGGYPANIVFQLYYRSELNDTEVKRRTL
jgi:Tfp pilus assembly protein PilO